MGDLGVGASARVAQAGSVPAVQRAFSARVVALTSWRVMSVPRRAGRGQGSWTAAGFALVATVPKVAWWLQHPSDEAV